MKRGSDGTRRFLAKCKSYRETTEMLAALGTIFKKRYGASIGMGRAVRRISADGAIMPDPVTPDMMVQGRGLNVVVEIKAGFPSGVHARQKIFRQLKKYDCKLVGWMEKDADVHDIMVATQAQNAAEMSRCLGLNTGAGTCLFSNPLCVAGFERPSAGKGPYFVRVVSGNLTNAMLRSYMRNGIVIDVDSMVLDFSTLWFYDSEPDPPYTMSILWEKAFPWFLDKEAAERAARGKTTPLRMSVDEIMENFQALAFSMPLAPRRRWIAKGMDWLVKIKMAKKGADGSYIVDYSLIEGKDLLEVFVRKWVGAQGGNPSGHA